MREKKRVPCTSMMTVVMLVYLFMVRERTPGLDLQMRGVNGPGFILRVKSLMFPCLFFSLSFSFFLLEKVFLEKDRPGWVGAACCSAGKLT